MKSLTTKLFGRILIASLRKLKQRIRHTLAMSIFFAPSFWARNACTVMTGATLFVVSKLLAQPFNSERRLVCLENSK